MIDDSLRNGGRDDDLFGIAMDKDEKKEVIDEANKIYGVKDIIPSIYLVTELSRNKL
mgnify:CR=1 FL=1